MTTLGGVDTQYRPAQTPRLADCTSWDSPAWKALKVLVIGIGKTGFSVADTLIELGCDVVVVDGNDHERNRQSAQTLYIVGAKAIYLGSESMKQLPQFDFSSEGRPEKNHISKPTQDNQRSQSSDKNFLPDLVITSPGFRPDHQLLVQACALHIPVWSDIELAWRVQTREGQKRAQWLCITGTNGKTTTTILAEKMAQSAVNPDGSVVRAIAAGNIGTPILDVIRDPIEYQYIIVELSSFQLHWTYSLEPLASTCLNIAGDHLDWHGNYAYYMADKARVYNNTRTACVYNVQDAETEKMVENADVYEGCRAVGFTLDVPYRSMLGIAENLLVDRAFVSDRKNTAEEIISIQELAKLLGYTPPAHFLANVLAASALVRAAGIEMTAIYRGITTYENDEHRLELVDTIDGRQFINDSKATNTHAVESAIASFNPVTWIAGGLDKGIDYAPLIDSIADKLEHVIVIGKDSQGLLEALKKQAPQVPVDRVDPKTVSDLTQEDQNFGDNIMKVAVKKAAENTSHSTVLLSPGAASMDQFDDYAHRGNAFKKAVAQLSGFSQSAQE